MEITEVRIKLMDDPHDRLQGFCSVTFDSCFVIRDLKIIQGAKGSFVAMPSRKLTDRCPRCNTKNHLRALHCNQCGARLQEDRATKDNDGRAKLYADIAHPINSECRDMIQAKVLEAYQEEQRKARLPGYICTYDDYGEENYAALHDDEPVVVKTSDGAEHRIEPAAETTKRGPHIKSNVESPNSTQAKSDHFGTGIL
ncbi:MAG: stage V sporulation protein G [Planctomycetaceae bacterium]|nr:stage V sporulation protein G [Planctomycetaceae bacterium]